MGEKNQLKISFTGDVLSGYLPFFIGTGYLASGYVKNQEFKLFGNKILDIFKTSDYNIINLESPVTNNIGYVNQNSFIGHTSFIRYLKQIGITHANLSNNHIDEHGLEIIEETISILKSNGIGFSGIDMNDYPISYSIKKHGNNVGIVSFNQIFSKRNLDVIYKYSPNISLGSKNFFSERTNYNIAMIHWGDEYINSPNSVQQKIGRQLIDNGFNVVIGHHPHVIQPFEDYNNGRIYYSLGNTLFDDLFSLNTRVGLIVKVIFNEIGEVNFEHHPVHLDRSLGVDYAKQKCHIRHFQRAINNPLIVDNKEYSKQQKKARVISRISMKTNLIKVFFLESNFKNKFLIIKNILTYYGLLKN